MPMHATTQVVAISELEERSRGAMQIRPREKREGAKESMVEAVCERLIVEVAKEKNGHVLWPWVKH
jgi:hypothetical protein